jgi:hypothetical protein
MVIEIFQLLSISCWKVVHFQHFTGLKAMNYGIFITVAVLMCM